ncbi:MAG: Asp-tRNA(Asn)/Glu-tRNA(Gln) amidotransferase subunit GatC [Candidatus Micrarchaeota archaeon]|nr:Asp-tRNA(Asn)/Glu-tRNA(Gln) amidotransferase subunit GatC [Candidatus Micrarchaeota archaeon]
MTSKAALIDAPMLRKTAEISRLRLDEKEAKEFQADFAEILDYFSRIAEIEARGKELYYVRDANTVLRKDAPEQREGEAEGVRSQFAKKDEGYMIAPRSL